MSKSAVHCLDVGLKPVVTHWSASNDRDWDSRGWVHERMMLNGDEWFTRIGPTPASATGFPPVVLIHGLVVSGTYFQPVASLLDTAMTLFVPDLPGTGRSSFGRRIGSFEDMADRLANWLIAHDLNGALLVANSMSCQILTLLAVRHPHLASALVLVSPTMDPAACNSFHLAMQGLKDVPLENRALWPVWLNDLLRCRPFDVYRALRTSLRDPQRDRLPLIQQPVRVVGGARDPIVSAAWVRLMAELIPRGSASILPHAPHAINFSNPHDLAREVMEVARSIRDQ